MRQISAVLFAALLVLLGASCTVDSIQPTNTSAPEFIEITSNPDVAVALDHDDGDGEESDGDGEESDGDDEDAMSASAWVSRAAGGVVSAGRYTVVVPPNAINDDYVKIKVKAREENGTVRCELLPHGITFQTPVTLLMNLSGTDASPLGEYTIYWWDDAAQTWVDIGGSFNPSTLTLSTQLPHFSTYSGGRGGW